MIAGNGVRTSPTTGSRPPLRPSLLAIPIAASTNSCRSAPVKPKIGCRAGSPYDGLVTAITRRTNTYPARALDPLVVDPAYARDPSGVGRLAA